MEFLELVKQRRSVRKYQQRAVEQQKLDYILECARLAPSACNRQPWRFFVTANTPAKDKIMQCYEKPWFSTSPAPLFIIACADTETSWKRPYDGKDHGDIDVSIALEHICLAAAEQGLGTCWICHFDPVKLSEVFELPSNLRPVAITPLGYPDDTAPENRPRKSADEIIKIL